jgi:membrane-bound lytic murein transglycosylase B
MMMNSLRRFRLALAVGAITYLACLPATGAPRAASAAFDDWVAQFRTEALAKGIRGDVFDQAFAGVQPLPQVIALDRRQPEHLQTFWKYLDSRITAQRVARGRAALAENRAVLDRVQEAYGVPPRFLVAFWGLESDYGGFTGSFPLVAALATLAEDERRSGFFRNELLALLELIQAGEVPADVTGSWAGAMGHPQFMPSSYRGYAVDFDGDGRRDLWSSPADIFASSARLLTESGWRPGTTWGREVRVPIGFDYALSGLESRRPLRDWQTDGVRDVTGGDLPAIDLEASLIFPGGVDGGPAFLVYDNFRTIMAWNRSILYAVAVGHLADRLAGGSSFAALRPAQEVALSRAQVVEMQGLLGRIGLDAGEPDGVVGTKTRQAVKSFQQLANLPADGYPSVTVLERLRATVDR